MNFDEPSKPKKKCCFVLPQEPWIKFWFIWAIMATIMMIGTIQSEPRDAIAYLPVVGICFFLVLLMALIFCHYGFDTYGGRITVFWAWLNGYLFSSLYTMFVNGNTLWLNVHHYKCFDMTGSMYSQEYIDCKMDSGMEANVGLLFAFIIDMWGAVELYRWAQNLREDDSDVSSVWWRNNPTCCCCIPLCTTVIWVHTSLTTIANINNLTFGAFNSEGKAIGPWWVLTLFPILLNIVQYVVLCSRMKDTYKGRMLIFKVFLILIVIVLPILYFLIAHVLPKSWNLVKIICEGSWEGEEMCEMKFHQYFFWDNLLGLYFNIYFATILYRWAC